MNLLSITLIGIKECLRRRVIYGIAAVAVLCLVLAKGCNPGTVRGERLVLNDEMRSSVVSAVALHGIGFWSFLLCCFLSVSVLSREIEQGTALLTLSRPLRQSVFVAGKLLSAFCLSVLHLILLGLLMYFFVCTTRGGTFVLALACLLPSLVLGTLMNGLFSLVLPRVVAPLLSVLIYATAWWTAVPLYVEKLRIIWTPSNTILRMYQLFPCFGDLQFIGASLLSGHGAGEHSMGTVINVTVYCVFFWVGTVVLFSRRHML